MTASAIYLHIGAPKTGTSLPPADDLAEQGRACARRASSSRRAADGCSSTRSPTCAAASGARRSLSATWDLVVERAHRNEGVAVISEEPAVRLAAGGHRADRHLAGPDPGARGARRSGLRPAGPGRVAAVAALALDDDLRALPGPAARRAGPVVLADPGPEPGLRAVGPLPGAGPLPRADRAAAGLGPEPAVAAVQARSWASTPTSRTRRRGCRTLLSAWPRRSLLRRFNVQIGERFPMRDRYIRVVRDNLMRDGLFSAPDPIKIGVPAPYVDWVRERSRQMVDDRPRWPARWTSSAARRTSRPTSWTPSGCPRSLSDGEPAGGRDRHHDPPARGHRAADGRAGRATRGEGRGAASSTGLPPAAGARRDRPAGPWLISGWCRCATSPRPTPARPVRCARWPSSATPRWCPRRPAPRRSTDATWCCARTDFVLDAPGAEPVAGRRTDVVLWGRMVRATVSSFADYRARLYVLLEPMRMFHRPEVWPGSWPADLGLVVARNDAVAVPLLEEPGRPVARGGPRPHDRYDGRLARPHAVPRRRGPPDRPVLRRRPLARALGLPVRGEWPDRPGAPGGRRGGTPAAVVAGGPGTVLADRLRGGSMSRPGPKDVVRALRRAHRLPDDTGERVADLERRLGDAVREIGRIGPQAGGAGGAGRGACAPGWRTPRRRRTRPRSRRPARCWTRSGPSTPGCGRGSAPRPSSRSGCGCWRTGLAWTPRPAATAPELPFGRLSRHATTESAVNSRPGQRIR
ncbi:hypothetical protein [Nocardioides convexus]|uniref:hypothetical protein n=1 Tax=Nocardioides convexus TaxID=2712224 RepID=UPI0024185543|nr:hypothetical protein [Nocardioides convexus]